MSYKEQFIKPETNTIYEFYGNYWHGNPEIYPSAFITKINGKTMKELYNSTKEREITIKSLGYSLVVMWESEFDKEAKQC